MINNATSAPTNVPCTLASGESDNPPCNWPVILIGLPGYPEIRLQHKVVSSTTTGSGKDQEKGHGAKGGGEGLVRPQGPILLALPPLLAIHSTNYLLLKPDLKEVPLQATGALGAFKGLWGPRDLQRPLGP